jgi:hypothetical protein
MFIKTLPNGQWTLEKALPAVKQEQSHNMPALHNEIGKTHTVEIHPDIDHLYNVKNFAQKDPRGKVKVIDIKNNQGLKHMANKVPRDAKGWVTPEAIDKHIAGLPKHKVNIQVKPYFMGAQQHRELPSRDKHQYVASMQLHPETLMGMKPEERKAWEGIKGIQHNFDESGDEDEDEGPPVKNEVDHQFGWARIDPWKSTNEAAEPAEDNETIHDHEPNHGHWHVDELQSDFQNKDKMVAAANAAQEPDGYDEVVEDFKNNPDHPVAKTRRALDEAKDKYADAQEGHKTHDESLASPEYKAMNEANQKHNETFQDALREKRRQLSLKPKPSIDHNKLHEHLSHGHDDPQHAIHSAVNALGRKMGVNSMSMDTPEDQARQSQLREHEDDAHMQRDDDASNALHSDAEDHANEHLSDDKHKEAMENHPNKYLKSALGKVSAAKLRGIVSASMSGSEPSEAIHERVHGYTHNNEHHDIHEEMKDLSRPERDALHEYLGKIVVSGPNWQNQKYEDIRNPEGEEADEGREREKAKLPAHQLHTYDKRPKKLGATLKDKKEVLGDDPSDEAKQVQYMKLHKKLAALCDLLKAGK